MDKVDCRYYATGGGQNYLPEPTIWLAVKDEDAHMLADDVYDAFLLVPLYIGMYYKEDLHIHGCVSKRLYKNVMNYLQRILCDFSDDLSRINVTVDGFKSADGEQNIIGAGISCGVDSLTTIYDHYVNEDDPEYKINGLFLFNYGSHGKYGDKSRKLYFDRYNLNKSVAEKLSLPVYLVDSNLHSFTRKLGGDPKWGYFANYSCILSLQRVIRKYYVSSAYSYRQIMEYGLRKRNSDFAEFSESYSVPLIRTEKLELISDGCQYERSLKIEHIAGWDIAQKHLNVCVSPVDGAHNCSKCHKCMTTLMTLDAIGSLNDFSEVFDINTYKHFIFKGKCKRVTNDFFLSDNDPSLERFLKTHGMKLPSRFTAYVYLFPSRLKRFTKRTARKLMGEKLYESIKRIIKH